MKWLSISTAEKGSSLAVVNDDALVYEEYQTSEITHSKRLMPMIENVFERKLEINIKNIDAYAVARGPGNFTGIRIGISVIKALSYAMQKPALGVSSLDGIAFQFLYSSNNVCAMIDARRKEVYCAFYKFKEGCLISKTNEMLLSPEKAVQMAQSKTLFAGSGSKVYEDTIRKKADNPVIANSFMNHVRAKALVLSLYSNHFEKDNDINTYVKLSKDNLLEPSYIRKPDC